MEVDDTIIKFLRGDHPKIWTIEQISSGTGIDLDIVKKVISMLLRWRRVIYDPDEGYYAYEVD